MLRALPVIVWLCGPAPRLRCGPAPSPPGRFACAGGGVVEYPGKVACPSGRRCSTRNAVWCQSHPGFKSQRYRHCRPAPLGPGGFVMPTWRVWGLVAPTDLRPPRGLPARSPSALRASLGASARSPARPRRPRGGLQSVGVSVCCLAPPPTGIAAWPSGYLRRSPHQWCQVSDVARCVGLLFGQAPPPPVGVTGVSCVEFLGWSGVCCYKRRQSDGFLAENGRYRSVRAMTSRKSRM